jgi:hypothetical protein
MDLLPKAADIPLYCALLAPLAAVGANVIAQVLAVRLRGGTQFFRSIIEGFVVGGIVLIALEISVPQIRQQGLVTCVFVNGPIYVALAYCYFGLANLGHTSIRLRMYSEISASPEGRTTREIEGIYDEGTLMQMRLQRLVESGDIVYKDGRYFVGRKKLVYMARILLACKHILLGKKSEFE